MSKAVEKLQAAQKYAMANRPKAGGFPFLAETLRKAGVTKNIWFIPACEAIYITAEGPVVTQGTPLVTGTFDIPKFDKEALVLALRTNQAGDSTFPEFLESSWQAGIVRYVVDFQARNVTYYGCNDESYIEEYPAVEINP